MSEKEFQSYKYFTKYASDMYRRAGRPSVTRPVVTYAFETRTLNKQDKNKFCVFERQILRNIFDPVKT
jgi:hypothetical protein